MSHPTTRYSLNEMVLDSLATLQEREPSREAFSAREITDFIAAHFGASYPIQTIIVVLNRMVTKQAIARKAQSFESSRNRFGFYLNSGTAAYRQDKILARFQSFADEFFNGNLNQALDETRKLVLNAGTSGTLGSLILLASAVS